MKVRFETFGCRLNRAEALEEEARYIADGWEVTEHRSQADLIVVRACSVTRRAESDCLKLIEHLKACYPNVRLRITGCIADAVKKGAAARADPLAPKSQDALPQRTARAYLKVQDGCSGRCTFCIVPKFRGPSVSVPFEDVIDKAKRFIDSGYREIVVTGCNLSLYASRSKRLPDLLCALASLTPQTPSERTRIRLGSLEPGVCDEETVAAIAQNENICRFLHLPVQTGSARILAAMGRPYTMRDVEKVVSAALKAMPRIALGCDIIAGFPGEEESDFGATLALIKRIPFSNSHIFPYSERPGTIASSMGYGVPRGIRIERARMLAAFAASGRKYFAKKFLGREVEVVVEETQTYSGWTSEYLKFVPVNPALCVSMRRKGLYRFVVTDVDADVLIGRPIK